MNDKKMIEGGGFPPLKLKKDKKHNNSLPVNIHEILNTKKKEIITDNNTELVTVTEL